ncbi:DeoR/GlpR family DNA-binding transcription regulator [Desulfoluna spongiiphila]|uniref:Transcriptional regulator, DeoR family n=1 Tax=Desulfoluna spongiiphila TaxID=419481 RepID=A0A1G5I2A9_9BACT|nr:DeoR family transcriptional regulator [Desulfoluna spongiiphila]SCY70255.1 transcriptional regulator, DeoR family [Desulfoluna spongiiphila]VVS92667.1 transcription regulator hth deor-type conserved site [Desulfoluna spongiiphila]
MNTGDREYNAADVIRTLPRRQKAIYDMVLEKGFVSIEGLSQHFSVTPQTIRRDINNLCSAKLLQRYHGGAGLLNSVENFTYSTRKSLCSEEKIRVAQHVAQFIPNNASLFLDIGTSTEEVARALVDKTGLRVITNNLNVASILGQNRGFEILVSGGVVRNHDLGITGEAAIDFISQFKVDFGIISVAGIDPDGTLIDFDYNEVRIARAIISNSRQVFLVADHSKFNRSAMVRIGNLEEVDALFTDRTPPASFLEIIKRGDVNLHIAPGGKH